MKKIVPIKNTVLCKKIKSASTYSGSILFKKASVDEFEILDFSSDDEFPFSVGDIVIVSSSGDVLDVDNEDLYLFKTEHVIAKIDNN